MQPIHKLSSEQKAVFLHQFLPADINGFLSRLERYALRVVKESSVIKLKKRGAGSPCEFEHWLKLATKAAHIIKDKRKDLIRDPETFAKELFGYHLEAFTLHYLELDTAICSYRFRDGVKFLFNLEDC